MREKQPTLQTPLSGRRWFLLGLLSVASFINYLDRATISVAVPNISAEFVLGPAAKGVLLSAFFWSYTLLQLPMGYLVDRYSLRWLYAGSFALWSLACGLAGFAHSLALLVFLRIVLGIGESVFLPGSIKFISVSFEPEERGFPSGLFSSGTRAGLALGAPIIAWLITRCGWRQMFVLVGFTGLAWIVPWLVSFPRKPAPVTKRPPEAVAERRKLPTLDRNLLGACLGYFSFGYFGYLLMTWLPDYFVEVRHVNLLHAGLYSAIPFLTWTLSEPAGGWVTDHLIRRGWNQTHVRKGVIGVGFAMGLLLIPAVAVHNLKISLLLLAGASLVGLSTANQLVIFQACAPPEEVGVWMGMGNFVANIGGIVSPLVTGILIARTGSYFAGFAVAPLILLAGFLGYGLVVRKLSPAPGAALREMASEQGPNGHI